MSFKYLAPVVAIAAGRVAAQSSCSAATTTIQNQGDASGLASCTTFSGSIAIATGTTDNIMLNNIEVITGDLVANNVSQLTSLSADSLKRIDGAFDLQDCQILSTLNFPQLNEVDSIEWVALAALQGLSFTNMVQKANSVSIRNTQLNSLDGINLAMVDTMDIQNNDYLDDITMQLGNVSTELNVYANGRNVSVILPNLEWAARISIANASVVSFPSLASVNGSLGLYSNSFESVQAPNLTDVGGTLAIVSNNKATNISFPQLTIVTGGLSVQNNTELADVSGFPVLETVGGALDMYGNAIETADFPALKDVKGAFNLQSNQNLDDACEQFQTYKDDSVIKGVFTCRGEETDPEGTGSDKPEGTTKGSGGSKGGSSGGDSEGAAGALKITGATGILGAVALLFGLL